jgi:hypothetical protein
MEYDPSFEGRLLAILKRPGMYLRKPDLASLEAYLMGWDDSERLNGAASKTMFEFQDWLAEKYGAANDMNRPRGINPSWHDMVMSRAGDDSKGLEKFSELFAAFIAERES